MSELRTEFKVERELPPAANAAGELEDQSPEIVTYTALWYVEGASGDGYNEPYVPAYPVLESVVDANGVVMVDVDGVYHPGAGDLYNRGLDAMNAEFNTANHDGEEDFGPFED